MRDILMQRLHDHLQANYPDLLLPLQDGQQVTTFLEAQVGQADKQLSALFARQLPAYELEALCMQVLTDALPPSGFNYITHVLQEEFETTYTDLKEKGILAYEALNMLEYCQPVFADMPLTKDNEDDRMLRYAVTGSIATYLQTTVG